MKNSLIVVDDFYSNPDEVRAFALSLPFKISGNYPGQRTENFINESTMSDIEYYIGEAVRDWPVGQREGNYTGSFQLTTKKDKSWIHVDDGNNWAGVLYLTPNAPLSGGTGFFKSKVDGSMTSTDGNITGIDGDAYSDLNYWEKSTVVGNVYNRLILFRSDQWHSSLDYFGTDKYDGRLTQVFFFST
jgi:hypothetical protein